MKLSNGHTSGFICASLTIQHRFSQSFLWNLSLSIQLRVQVKNLNFFFQISISFDEIYTRIHMRKSKTRKQNSTVNTYDTLGATSQGTYEKRECNFDDLERLRNRCKKSIIRCQDRLIWIQVEATYGGCETKETLRWMIGKAKQEEASVSRMVEPRDFSNYVQLNLP
jgi:hypothetical protein